MLVTLIVTLVIIGLLIWLVEMFIPIDFRIKQVIYVLVGIYVILMVLEAFGVHVPVLDKLMPASWPK